MRIVLIADTLDSSGGASKIGLRVVEAFRSMKIPVSAIIGDSNSDKIRSQPTISLGQEPLLEAGASAAIFRGLYNIGARNRIRAFIEKEDTPSTIYIVNSWFQILSPSVFSALNKVISRVLVFAHDFFIACPNGAFYNYRDDEVCELTPMSLSCIATNCDKRNYVHKMWRGAVSASLRIQRPFGPDGCRVVVVHEGMTEHLGRAGIRKDNISVLRNPSTPFVDYGLNADLNKEILYVGSLSAQKGFDLVLAIAKERGWIVNVFGAGEFANQCGEFPSVSLNGVQPKEVIGEVARRCRFLVMPSRQRETFGLAAVEAIGSGLPVIVTEQMFIAKDIKIHNCGVTIKEARLAPLIEACDSLFQDDDLVRRLGINARHAVTFISPTDLAWQKELLYICEKLLSRSKQNGERG